MIQKAHLGDIFLIPIDPSRFGIGQIAGDWKGELYLVIYDQVCDGGNVNPENVIGATPLFACLSLDAKIYNGDWRIVGNLKENLQSIPQPVFKVNQDGKVYLETRDRSFTRLASENEARALRLRTVVAPIRIEKALKAFNGIGEWNPIYDDLRYSYALESSQYSA